MTDLFYSPRLTLVRAQHHIRDFKAIVNEFRDKKPWSYFVDKQSEPGNDVHKIQFTEQAPEILPCILFDAANNLRAVLDQAGFASALASGKTNPKKTNFPFADDLASLNNNLIGRDVCKDLPPEILALFRGFKPYKGGNNTLWALNRLCNTKKHCALIPLEVSGPVGKFSGQATIGDIDHYLSRIRTDEAWNARKREMTLLAAPSEAKAKISGHFSFTVAIDGIEVLRGEDAICVLDAMCSKVESILMATEVECRRLGFQIA